MRATGRQREGALRGEGGTAAATPAPRRTRRRRPKPCACASSGPLRRAPLMWLLMGPMAGPPVVMLTGAGRSDCVHAIPADLGSRSPAATSRAASGRSSTARPTRTALIAVGSGTARPFWRLRDRFLRPRPRVTKRRSTTLRTASTSRGRRLGHAHFRSGVSFQARASAHYEAVTALTKLCAAHVLAVRDGAEVRIGTDEVASGSLL